ncbi:hypothetical protein ACJIZ3_007780 [Penstemon smallii]|uniref:Myb-like domain-containing protein n=1 Tax=Penstemon smallii TaxID=265156 RepID=A0ABD3T7X4_9LAMI
MATIISLSSPSAATDDIPTATLAIPSTATTSSSRRLPPPCWSPNETTALIHAYREKWYSLRRGNLRANHWQEVADDVASRCPVTPPKTSVQCRHKMEKLRKRYRSEIQRAAGGFRRVSSSWDHFQLIHDMEKGPNNNPTPPSSDEEEIEDNNNQNGVFGNQGFRIKIPGRVPPARVYSKYNEMDAGQNYNNPNPRFGTNYVGSGGYEAGSSKVSKDGLGRGVEMGKRKNDVDDVGGVVGEVVTALKVLGEGFMRIEKVKMDMARQVEEMRMEMELKRTEMILESQQRIVEAFVEGISERSNKKAKRMSNSP